MEGAIAKRRMRAAARRPRGWPAKRADGRKAAPLEARVAAYRAAAAGEAAIVLVQAYRAELGAVASSYIGETEKNLEAAFAAAQPAEVTLLFDEADALLGERREVSDANHPYRDDVIVLDPAAGAWRGQLYLERRGAIRAGVYTLSGPYRSYRRLRRRWWQWRRKREQGAA
jgi:hypothetical protein